MRNESTSQADAWYERALASAASGDFISAERCYRRAIQLNPHHVAAANNLANVLKSRGDLRTAEALYRQVLQLAPDFAIAHNNLGTLYFDAAQWLDASHCFRRALAIQPDYPAAAAQLLACLQQLCEWQGLDSLSDTVLNYLRRGEVVPPMGILAMPDAGLEEQRICARSWAAMRMEVISRANPAPVYPPRSSTKLRIGYLSSDFHDHAVAYLAAELFELHDRKHFEIIAYSYGPDDKLAMRRRLERAFDRFDDIRALPDVLAAKKIHADEIDVLVDLTGFTGTGRSGILAYRPAPIQAQFLGFPGTMGTKLVDYLIADRFVVPAEYEQYYAEKIVRLPHCYQPNDRQRVIGSTPSRKDAGLPEAGFVFCSFNQTFKITPSMFRVWMRLLRAVSGSVLWMLESNSWVLKNLKREAENLGIDGSRLIVAPKRPMSEHLGRLKLADLMLDTSPYNSHTTASDALWTGVPILTLPGQTFASRVAGSLLNTMALPELIAGDLQAYERKALEIALNPTQLTSLRKKLMLQRGKSPLFNTQQFVKDLESIYLSMAAQALR